jgi:cytochrome P450
MRLREEIPFAPVDLAASAFTTDPIGSYDQIRNAGRLVRLPGGRAYMATGYHDVAAGLRNAKLGIVDYPNSWAKIVGHFGRDHERVVRLLAYMPFTNEGPRHEALRSVLARGVAPFAAGNPAFAPSLAAKIERLRRDGGGDLAADLSRRMLFDMMCDLMEIPVEERSAMGPVANLSWAMDTTLSLKQRDYVAQYANPGLDFLKAHARATIGKSNPVFLTALYDALPPGEEDKFEAVALMAAILLLMGNDAIGACVSMGVRRLLDASDPGPPQREWAKVADDAIRYASPVDYTIRRAEEDTVAAGCPITKGQHIFFSFLAGSHDPAVFGKRHSAVGTQTELGLAFGTGRHLCVGQRLSRTIVKLAFEALAALPPMRLTGHVEFGTGRLVRTLESLPVELV